jgi:hypothetical protein
MLAVMSCRVVRRSAGFVFLGISGSCEVAVDGSQPQVAVLGLAAR